MKIEHSNTVNIAENKQANPEKIAEFRQACAGFEAMFITHLLQQMRKSIPEGEFFGKSQGEKLMEGLMDDEYAKALSSSSGIGLANILYQQLKDTIE